MSSEFDAGRDWREKFREQEALSRHFFEKAMADARRKSRKAAMGLWSGPLVSLLLAGFIWYWRGPVWALMGSGVALAWSGVGAWMGLRLRLRRKAVEESGVEFLRGELIWQRRTLERGLVWGLAPMALGLGLLVATVAGKEEAALVKMMPFCLLCLGWVVGFIGLRWKQLRELAGEMEALAAAER